MMKTNQMMNIQSIVYRIASIIEMIDKILKNGIELFLIDECRSFLMMMNHCRDFLMNEIDDCRDFAVFLKFLIEMKMKMIV